MPRLPIVASPTWSPCPSPPRSPTSVEPCSPVPSSPEGSDEMFVPGEVRPTSVIENLTRMIDISILTMHDDPFFSVNDTVPRTPFMREISRLAVESPKPAMNKPDLMPASPKPVRNIKDPVKRNPLIPSPLRIRKASADVVEDGSKRTDENDSWTMASARPRPPPLPLRIIPVSRLNVNNQPASRSANDFQEKGIVLPTSLATSTVTISNGIDNKNEAAKDINPARAAQIVRFNRGIDFLHEQIKTNIAQIQQHVDHVEEIQRARRSRKMQRVASFWSFSPVKSERGSEEQQAQEPVMDQFGNILIKETKQQRISRLRREGWNTVGLRSPNSTWKGARYYQEFCNMVMNELYLNQ